MLDDQPLQQITFWITRTINEREELFFAIHNQKFRSTDPEVLNLSFNVYWCLAAGGDIVVMIHPDYQYTPQLLPAMASMVASGLYPCVLGSRILGGGALKGGMPWWKYVSNRFLTAVENFLIGAKLSEYHTGYRAFARTLLERLPIEKNSNDFVFDNQMLTQIVWLGCNIGEVTCPAKYMPEMSSINFRRSVRYGLACLGTALRFRLARWRLASPPI